MVLDWLHSTPLKAREENKQCLSKQCDFFVCLFVLADKAFRVLFQTKVMFPSIIAQIQNSHCHILWEVFPSPFFPLEKNIKKKKDGKCH